MRISDILILRTAAPFFIGENYYTEFEKGHIMAKLLLAKEVNEGLKSAWEEDLSKLSDRGVTPTLATVRVGQKGPDISYEKGIVKKMTAYDLGVKNIVLDEDIDQESLIGEIEKLSNDTEIHGILLFQPLDERFDDRKVKEAICKEKDVDCATAENLGSILAGWADGFSYCAPQAVMETLKFYDIPIKGREFCIIGSGLVVGRPLAMLLSNELATVSLCNVFTEDSRLYSKKAHVLISACGVPGLIDETYVSPGQVIIDVGTSFVNGKLKGDVNREAVEDIVEALTPTPGGVSGITTTVLAKHLIRACKNLTEGGK